MVLSFFIRRVSAFILALRSCCAAFGNGLGVHVRGRFDLYITCRRVTRGYASGQAGRCIVLDPAHSKGHTHTGLTALGVRIRCGGLNLAGNSGNHHISGAFKGRARVNEGIRVVICYGKCYCAANVRAAIGFCARLGLGDHGMIGCCRYGHITDIRHGGAA